MGILRNPKKSHIISNDFNLSEVIKVLHKTKAKLLFVCDEDSRLIGVVSQGDVNTFLSNDKVSDKLSCNVKEFYNTEYKSLKIGFEKSELNTILSDYKVVPILGTARKLIKVAFREDFFDQHQICGINLKNNMPAIIIAEIGNNHNGDIDLAKNLIQKAIQSGADIVKFQMRDITALYGSEDFIEIKQAKDLGAEYLMELLNENQLKHEELLELFDYTKSLGKQPLCTPWDEISLKILDNYGMKTIKIASADLTNHNLLGMAADMGMVLICSTGMATEEEVRETSEYLRSKGAIFYFLHCQSSYPASLNDINLSYMDNLKIYSRGSYVGYSSHELGINICTAAVARGAKIIEKHFTVDKSLKGIDHRVSLLPEEFLEMVNSIREIELAIGRSDRRILSQGELINRATLSKSIFTKKDLKKGEIIKKEDLIIKSPGNGVQPNRINKFIGKKLNRNLSQNVLIYPEDIQNEKDLKLVKNNNAELSKKKWSKLPGTWGIPVRPHDFEKLKDKFSPKMIEFHLSYNDLKTKPSDFCKNKDLPYCVIHAPELFANELLLDLCSFDKSTLMKSIDEMKRVISFSEELLDQLKNQEKIGVITNVGGHSDNAFLPIDLKQKLPEILIESLNKLNNKNVEIWPQTMPPYPWHFGGQRFHNLFVDPKECIELAEKIGVKLCVDISHTKLACNFLKIDFFKILPNLLKHTTHLHIADANTENGEGLQIDKGDINFLHLLEIMKGKMREDKSNIYSWIPEVWQGHENNGKGFEIAFDRLLDYF